MHLESMKLDHGNWVTEPPDTIAAGATAVFQAAGKSFPPTGTQGSVIYSLAGNPQNAKVTMTFDVPLIGADSTAISADPPDALSVSATASGGDQDNIRFEVGAPAPALVTPIKHVFLLMLENRSLDHMLGFSGIKGADAQDGSPTQIDGLTGNESNTFQETVYKASKPADFVMPSDPGHEFTDVVQHLCGDGATYPNGGPYPPIDNSGFVASYSQHGGQTASGGLPEIMKCFDSPAQLPVLYTLATEFAVCDHWYASMPGPTWPNRFFAAAASSGGLDHSPSTDDIITWLGPDGFSFENGTIFDLLKSHDLSWKLFSGSLFPVNAALKGITIEDVTLLNLLPIALSPSNPIPYEASFTFIEPNYGDVIKGTYLGGDSQHPVDDVTKGDALIKTVYEAIRNSPIWKSSMLIVTWDEHGGFYDHAAPPAAVPPGDRVTTKPGKAPINQYGFKFDQYGVRVPAVVVSAYTPKNVIDHRTYDHASILATVEAVFNLSPLTDRDKAANNLTPLVSLTEARDDTPEQLPGPAASPASFAKMQAAAAVSRPATVEDRSLPGFLHVAMRADIQLSPPAERPAIIARVDAIKTRDQAEAYMQEVTAKIQTIKPPVPNQVGP